MKTVTNSAFLQKEVAGLKRSGKTIGFVSTMGYLHEGHLSLIRKARQDCKVVVVSIFVNPLQFGPREDLRKYPRDLNRDIALCKRYTDILFFPNAKAMYPEDFLTSVEVRDLSNILCGASRPGHFKGVTTVVNKLFNIVLPDIAYFGQKDAQQAVIIKKMVKDLNMPIEIKVLPIVREYDGLAMSSRNAYLTSQERKDAIVLYKSLILARKLVKKGSINCKNIISKIRKLILKAKTAKIDYINIVNPKTLSPLKIIKKEALILLAVFIGKTRLIDNMIIRR
ncbi:MAG: pantoate--beta-alanine ligase [Candidatus Omnitrophica bacterium]|nr:pantoate--beta-alanine ligase [Candidatus Omnitrophota bacterium]